MICPRANYVLLGGLKELDAATWLGTGFLEAEALGSLGCCIVYFFFLLFLIILMGCKALGRIALQGSVACCGTSFAPAFSLLRRCSEVPLPRKPAAFPPAEMQTWEKHHDLLSWHHPGTQLPRTAQYFSVSPPDPCH